MLRQEKSPLCVGLDELQAYTRVETGEEEAILAGLLRVATELCEEFLSQALLVRQFEQDMTAREAWNLLTIQPVRSVGSILERASGTPIDPGSYRVDIDHDGRAFVHGLALGERVTVRGEAGMGQQPNDIPEPIRQGILRLAASLFAHRDNASGEVPKAVTALWRPYRRAGLCR